MARWIRRLLFLALVGGGVFAVLRNLQRRRVSSPPLTNPEWPPFADDLRVPVPPATPIAEIVGLVEVVEPDEVAVFEIVEVIGAEPSDEPTGEAAWVPPIDGQRPPGYPIKAKVASHIYHVPGGRSYDRTAPDRCYATSESAEQDGYRQAKA